MTSKISAKFLDMFRNLKADAVPKAPRQEGTFGEDPEAEAHNENVEFPDSNEEVFIGVDGEKKNKKNKNNFKKNFFGKRAPDRDKDDDKDRRNSEGSASSSTVNTQATGHVINIVNSKDVHMGDEHVYHMTPMDGLFPPFTKRQASYNAEEPIKKTNLIILVMEADIKPEHDYMDYISKNLGKNWYSVFRKMGYSQGRIETAEIDNKGISEARYKLLLDWVRNDDDGTLGKLATLLWDDGERQIVKELAAMYHNKQD